jgi:hypothetical protein
MEPGSLRAVAPDTPGPRTPVPASGRRKIRIRATLAAPVPDEPIAVVLAGGDDGGHSAVLGALLGTAEPVVDVPAGSYLVVGHGHCPDARAYVPGNRQAHVHRPGRPAGEAAPVRPPRRVETSRPDPLLRHFTLVDAPDTARLGVAGTRVLVEVARRGGAVVYVFTADRPTARADVDVLAHLVRAGVRVFLVLTPDADGGWAPPSGAGRTTSAGSGRVGSADSGPVGSADSAVIASGAGGTVVCGDGGSIVCGDHQVPSPGPVAAALDARRAALAAEIPALAGAPWFAVDPSCDDTTYLRRALVEWAGVEGLRRASDNPPVPPGAGRTVRVGSDAHESGWAERLERSTRDGAETVARRLTAELAEVQRRCTWETVANAAGCAALPETFDRELHALSLRTVAEMESAAAALVDDVLRLVLAEPLHEGVRRRAVDAVRSGFDDDPDGDDLARVLLVTSTGGVASVAGEAAVAALWAYHPPSAPPLLPPVGVGLSAGCYRHWRNPANTDTDKARSWLQRAVRAVELELLREVSRRFAAVERSFAAVVGEAVDHGILLR